MGRAAQVRLQAEGSRRRGREPQPRRFRGRGRRRRAKVLLPQKRSGAARTGPGSIRLADAAQGRLHADHHAGRGQERSARRHRLLAARAGDADLQPGKHRPVPDRHGRDHAGRHASRSDFRRTATADQVRRPVALLPHRGRRPGRDTRGLYRVHQFTKVEMFAFYDAGPERSDASGIVRPGGSRCSRGSACPTR